MIDLKIGDVRDKFIDENVQRYPDYSELISKLAKMNGVGDENILLVNGVDGAIDLVIRVYGERTAFPTPTYYEFDDVVRRNDKIKVENFDEASLILLCNPNNPFGLMTKDEEIGIVKKAKGMVAIDESYIDFAGDTVVNEINNYKNLIVFRGFAKGFGLAGIRVGYIVANKEIIKNLTSKMVLWPVSQSSMDIAIKAIDMDYRKELVAKIIARREKMEKFFVEKGFKVIPTLINKIILKFENEEKAKEYFDYLKENEISVNLGNGFSTVGLDNSYVTIVCGLDSDIEKLFEVTLNHQIHL